MTIFAWLISQETGEVAHELTSTTLIGRKDCCDIRLVTPTVSGEQCRIRQVGSCLEIEDLSSNGTFLNGRLVGKGKVASVADGDVLRLTKYANKALHFRVKMAPPAPPDVARAQETQAAAPTALPGTVAACAAGAMAAGAVVGDAARAASAPAAPTDLPPAAPPSSSMPPVRSVNAAAAGPAAFAASGYSASGALPSAAAADVQRDLAEQVASATALADELQQTRAELAELVAADPKGAGSVRPFACDGLRAAEETMQEAERAGLARQRSVLEAELAERRAAHELLRLEVARIEGAAEQAYAEHQRMASSLDELIRNIAGLTGQQEALRQGIDEEMQAARDASDSLSPAWARGVDLETQLGEARCELGRVKESELVLRQRIDRRADTHSQLQRLARDLAEDILGHATRLSDSLLSCASAARMGNDAAGGALGASGSGAVGGALGITIDGVGAGTGPLRPTQKFQRLLGGPARTLAPGASSVTAQGPVTLGSSLGADTEAADEVERAGDVSNPRKRALEPMVAERHGKDHAAAESGSPVLEVATPMATERHPRSVIPRPGPEADLEGARRSRRRLRDDVDTAVQGAPAAAVSDAARGEARLPVGEAAQLRQHLTHGVRSGGHAFAGSAAVAAVVEDLCSPD